MDMMIARMLVLAADAAGNCARVFDWDKAARIIIERGASDARAGLQDDHEYTGGVILSRGKIVLDSYLYLGSLHAAPELVIGEEYIECWILDDDECWWNEKTVWPESARDILEASDK